MVLFKCSLVVCLIILRSVSISNSILQSLYSDLLPKRRKQHFNLPYHGSINVEQPDSSTCETRVNSVYKRARKEVSDAQNYGDFLLKACRKGDIGTLLECSDNDILSFI